VDDKGDANIVITSDALRFHSGGTSVAGEVMKVHRSRPNDDDLPTVTIRDMWDGTTSADPGVILAAMRQISSASYYLQCLEMGDIVWVATANGTTKCFECILDHNSTTVTEAVGKPWTGSSWQTYWRDLNSADALGGTPDPAKAWALGNDYDAPNHRFSVRGNVRIWTNQTQTSTSTTVGAAPDFMTIYDSSGTAVGEIPICAVGTFST
jgi:hypothetical protein